METGLQSSLASQARQHHSALPCTALCLPVELCCGDSESMRSNQSISEATIKPTDVSLVLPGSQTDSISMHLAWKLQNSFFPFSSPSSGFCSVQVLIVYPWPSYFSTLVQGAAWYYNHQVSYMGLELAFVCEACVKMFRLNILSGYEYEWQLPNLELILPICLCVCISNRDHASWKVWFQTGEQLKILDGPVQERMTMTARDHGVCCCSRNRWGVVWQKGWVGTQFSPGRDIEAGKICPQLYSSDMSENKVVVPSTSLAQGKHLLVAIVNFGRDFLFEFFQFIFRQCSR